MILSQNHIALVSWLCASIVCYSNNIHAQPDSACFKYPEILQHVRQLQIDGHSGEALDCLEKAVERFPENRDVLFAYIRILGQSKQFDEAFHLLKTHSENSAEYSRLKADLFWYQGVTDSACVWYGNTIRQTKEPDSMLIVTSLRACNLLDTADAKVRFSRGGAAVRYLHWNSQRTETVNEIDGTIQSNSWSASCLLGVFSRQYPDKGMHDVLIDVTGAWNITEKLILSLKAAYTPQQDFLATVNVAAGFEWYFPAVLYISGEGACLKYDVWFYRLTAVLGWEHPWTTGQIRVMSTVSPLQTGAVVCRFRLLLRRFIVEPVFGIGVSPTVNSFSMQLLSKGESAAGSGIGYRFRHGFVFILNGGVERANGNTGFFTGCTFEWEP